MDAAPLTSSIALRSAWQAQEASEFAAMRRRAAERAAELDADVPDWRSLRHMAGHRQLAAREAIAEDVRVARQWWRDQLRERGLDQPVIARLLNEYEQAYMRELRARIFGF
jgi:hypothetical protein